MEQNVRQKRRSLVATLLLLASVVELVGFTALGWLIAFSTVVKDFYGSFVSYNLTTGRIAIIAALFLLGLMIATPTAMCGVLTRRVDATTALPPTPPGATR